MKKTTILFALLISALVFISSCRTHELCPAYGKKAVQTTEKRV